jgi:hypothetical protein
MLSLLLESRRWLLDLCSSCNVIAYSRIIKRALHSHLYLSRTSNNINVFLLFLQDLFHQLPSLPLLLSLRLSLLILPSLCLLPILLCILLPSFLFFVVVLFFDSFGPFWISLVLVVEGNSFPFFFYC